MRFILIFLLFTACTRQVPVGKIAVPATTSPTEKDLFATKGKFLDNGRTLRIYVSVEHPKDISEAEFAQQMSMKYSLLPEYNSRQVLQTAVLSVGRNMTLQKVDGKFMLAFDVSKPSVDKQLYTGVVTVQFVDNNSGTNFQQDIFVRYQSGKTSDYYAVFRGEWPVLQNYAAAGDTLRLMGLSKADTLFKGFRYAHEFDPALPPMATARPPAKPLFADSLFTIQTKMAFVPDKEGLHFFTRDTSDTYGVGIFIVNDRYPRLTQAEQLTRPLVYVSTSQESNELWNSTAPKRSLDLYWLALANGNQSNARRNIAGFYRRVEQANQRFTSYKEGWKTDRGMVYIVMGQPQRISRTKDREIWTYTKRNAQFSEVNFTFVKRANPFVEDHYDLSRFVEFQPVWYPAVEAWRSGKVE